MTSEVENILKGQLVRKVEADKAIGVSTANLVPDEKGEVPLSKQSRFDIVSEQAPTLQAPVPDALIQAPEVTDAALQTPAPDALVQTPQVPETPAPDAILNDTINDAPVDVVSPAELSSVDMNSLIPTPTTIEEQPKEVIEPKVEEKIELPEMPNTILAAEPVNVNNDLFVGETNTNSQVEEQENSNLIDTELDKQLLSKEEKEVPKEVFSGDSVALVNDTPKEEEKNEMGEFTSDLLKETVPEGLEELPNNTESLPKELEDNKSIFQTGENLEKPEMNELGENSKGYEKKLDKILDSLKSLEELNVVIERLDNINKSVIELKDALTERHETIKEEGTLEQFTPSAPEIPIMDSLIPSIPSEEVKKEELPLTNESTPNDVPMLDNQSLNASGLEVPYVGPTLNEESNQSPDDISNIDESPIKGGMFV